MEERYDKKLVKSFPMLYRDRCGDKRKTSMVWGFSANSGWYPLIFEASKKIEALINEKYPDLRATQVKEKFGSLRLYTSVHYDDVEEIISKAAKLSYKTCDICGLAGTPSEKGWIAVRCDKHKEAWHSDGIKYDIHWTVMLKHYLLNWKYYL